MPDKNGNLSSLEEILSLVASVAGEELVKLNEELIKLKKRVEYLESNLLSDDTSN